MITYLICGTQRSGSTLIGELLADRGIAGAPREYLIRWDEYSDSTDPIFWRMAVERTKELGRTDNGVWGCKVMASYFPKAMNYLRCVPEVRGLDDWELAQKAFGSPRILRLRRRDTIRQAISRYIAEHTGIYYLARDEHEQNPELKNLPSSNPLGYSKTVPFDFDAIKTGVATLTAENQYWDDMFARANTPTHNIVYEDFVTDTARGTDAILDFLEVPQVGMKPPKPSRLRKMSNDVNEQFYQQYCTLAGNAPASE